MTNGLAPIALEGALIPGGAPVERQLWTITKGAYSDMQTVGPFIGTEVEVNALLAELNLRDAENIHFDYDQYAAEPTKLIASADDVLAAKPVLGWCDSETHGAFDHAQTPECVGFITEAEIAAAPAGDAHGEPGHDGTPGNCEACHAELFGVYPNCAEYRPC